MAVVPDEQEIKAISLMPSTRLGLDYLKYCVDKHTFLNLKLNDLTQMTVHPQFH